MAARGRDGENIAAAASVGLKAGALTAFALLMLSAFGGSLLVSLGILEPMEGIPVADIVLIGAGVGFVASLIAWLRFERSS